MAMFSVVPLNGLPLTVPIPGSLSSTASRFHQRIATGCHRMLSTDTPVQVHESSSVSTSDDRKEGSAIGPLERHANTAAVPYKSMVIPSARSSPSFFENRHGFPASALGVRHFHTGAGFPGSYHPLSAINSRSFGSWGRRNLVSLEEEADDNPKIAKIQAEYLKELVKVEPQWVVERIECGRFAVNAECARYYVEALTKLGRLDMLDGAADISKLQGIKKFSRQDTGENKSSNEGPKKTTLHVTARTLFYILIIAGLGKLCFVYIYYLLGATLIASGAGNDDVSAIMPQDNKREVTFADVAGVTEAKDELKLVVDFLRSPEKYTRLGAQIPKGVLLVGPPGNGKTLMARAVAGEAGVPFFFATGAQFDEKYVGVGASRVRKLFAEAKRNSPSIIFIDELDAVGAKRSNNPDHVHYRQTINQLLVEMDGFEENSGVVVIAATNTPKVLDKALTRPGRFDIIVPIRLPDVRGRVEMLKLHTKKLKLADDVNLIITARGTPQFTGAQLQNLANQAAIKAAVDNASSVRQEHFDYAKDKVIMGMETRSRKQAMADLRNTAYHEAGHALVSLLTPGTHPVYKATIVPRGYVLGMVQMLPDETKGLNQSKEQMKAEIAVALGGLVGEEVEFGKDAVTGGASSDLEKATTLATSMITRMGMNDKVGRRVVNTGSSETLMQTVDEEVRITVEEAYEYAKDLLTKNQAKHKALAEALLKYETLTSDEMRDIIAGKSLTRTI